MNNNNNFKTDDVVKHRQTQHRAWRVVSYNRRTGRLILQRSNGKGRLITRAAERPEEYRVMVSA